MKFFYSILPFDKEGDLEMVQQKIESFCKQVNEELHSGVKPSTIRNVIEQLENYSNHPELLFLLGKCYFVSNQLEEASTYFYQAINHNSTNAEHYAYYAWTRLKLSDDKKATIYIDKAIELDSENATTLLIASLRSFNQEDYETTTRFIQKGLKKNEHQFHFLKLQIEMFLKTGKANQEIIYLIEKSQKYGSDDELDYTYAKLLYMDSRYDECKKFCRKFTMKYPNSQSIDKFRKLITKMKENENRYKRIQGDGGKSKPNKDIKKEKVIPIEDLLAELDEFIGLENVKKTVHEMINVLKINQVKQQRGLKTETPTAPHMIFYGNPGTGKTTIARLMGKLFRSIGLLENGHLVEVRREDLVGQYIGHTEDNTKAKIEEALGGVLLIDEAYTLVENNRGGSNDFGLKAMNVLLPALTNHAGEFLVIATGYQDEMDLFVDANPGLKDRFTKKIYFDNYVPDELMLIFNKLCNDGGYTLTEEAREFLHEEFVEAYRKRDKTFGNARLVEKYFKQIYTAQSNRVASIPQNLWDDELLVTLTEQDVATVFSSESNKSFDVPINEELLQERIGHLNSLIGLQSVKEEIKKLVSLVRYYKNEGKDTKKLIKHTLLLGNPGTGKTEVARILAGIYEALGILERGELIEVDRNGLVDKYRGGTEEKTLQKIDKAMGGTLFIDEAYALTNKDSNDPGHAALELLLKKMSDLEGKFMVIAAGYSREMEQFLDSNSGLRRRFGLTLHFEDYNPDELMEISKHYLKENELTEEAELLLFSHYEKLYNNRNRTFGNAGFAKKVISQTIHNRDYRMTTLGTSQISEDEKKKIEADDIVLIDS